jgi:hypothetical protein
MKREDRQLLADLSQVNTALPEFALRVMENTATVVEHHALASRLIALGQAIGERAAELTIVNAHPNDPSSKDMAAIRALSALVDIAEALCRASACPDGGTCLTG